MLGSAAGGTGGGAPVGLAPGVRPLDHLGEVLASVDADRELLVLTHRNPDPDALGAMTGLAFLLDRFFRRRSRLATVGRVFRAENQAMVRELDLSTEEYDGLDLSAFAAVLLVDSQPTFGHTQIPETLPVAAVFDHHEPQACEPGDFVHVAHYDVRLGTGATSTIIYEYLRDSGTVLDARTATALCCGVRFDTADLSVHATDLDREAFFETFRAADRAMLARIQSPELPASYYRELHRSLARARRYGPLVFGLLGRVSNPESVAEMADFFLRMEGCRWTLVGGAYEGTYHLSLRVQVGCGDACPLMGKIIDGEGSFGGRGPIAGAQIQLESGDESNLSRLERRLRARALKLVAPEGAKGSDPKGGVRLTRLP